MTRLIWVGVGMFLAFAIAYCSLKTAQPRTLSSKPPAGAINDAPRLH